jgi:hypothetical protein
LFPDLFGRLLPGHLSEFERSSRVREASPYALRAPLAATLYPQSVTTIRLESSGPQGGPGEVLGALSLIGIGGAADAI